MMSLLITASTAVHLKKVIFVVDFLKSNFDRKRNSWRYLKTFSTVVRLETRFDSSGLSLRTKYEFF